VQGTLESHLTPRGRGQAEDLGRWLSQNEPSVSRIVVSPKQRTRETLSCIAAACPGLSEMPTEARYGLREIELTMWEGKMRADITAGEVATAEMPDADGARWNLWKADPTSFAFREDGHEPFRCLWERAGSEWKNLCEEAVADVPTLVVAHGAFNRALLLRSFGLQEIGWRDDVEHFLFDNCECVEIQLELSQEGVGGSPCAARWRRRYPHESEWRTLEEEVQRATQTYLANDP